MKILIGIVAAVVLVVAWVFHEGKVGDIEHRCREQQAEMEVMQGHMMMMDLRIMTLQRANRLMIEKMLREDMRKPEPPKGGVQL